jgi:hydroxymethylpyrimidine/phosphomethylpyrimidine kinase
MNDTPAVLVIAGSDSSGGAGLGRDFAVLNHFGVRSLCAVTAVTAQSNSRVSAIHHVPPAIIGAQIASALETCPVAAIKIGMLGTGASVCAVADSLPPGIPVVLDPVLESSSGATLLDEEGRGALRERLLPKVTLLTPNIPEAAALLGGPLADSPDALLEQVRLLEDLGARAVLVKGGHGSGLEAVDWLVEGGAVHRIASPRLPRTHRGTGCALASAVAASLATGMPLLEACQRAKRYVVERLLRSRS